ncbi:MAG: hypothetical protein EXR76_11755 [Myxococcales bacterium]|nr:hypothetical protein [Myxococcales bacterium]
MSSVEVAAPPGDALAARVDGALATFRELTEVSVTDEVRAPRLRDEVLGVLAEAYATDLRGGSMVIDADPTLLPAHARATFAATRTCLVLLGCGRGHLSADSLRDVLRLGESFSHLYLRVLDRQDQTLRGPAAKQAVFTLRATLNLVAAETLSDLVLARRARQQFSDLGDAASALACADLISRIDLTSQLDPVSRLGGPGVALMKTLAAPPPPVPEGRADTEAQPTPFDRRGMELADTIAAGLPVVTAATALDLPQVRRIAPRPAPPSPSTGRRLTWPPPRDERAVRITTVSLLLVLAFASVLGLRWARRAVAEHRAAQVVAEHHAALETNADAQPSAVPAARLTGAVPLPPSAVRSTVSFTIDVERGTSRPLTTPTAAPSEPVPIETSSPDAAVPTNTPTEDPRTAARRINAEGFRAYEAGQLEEARSAYAKAALADPTFGLPQYNVACIQALKGDAAASLAALKRYHALEPETDLEARITSDRDFARLRLDPEFRAAVLALMGGVRPEIPEEPSASPR